MLNLASNLMLNLASNLMVNIETNVRIYLRKNLFLSMILRLQFRTGISLHFFTCP